MTEHFLIGVVDRFAVVAGCASALMVFLLLVSARKDYDETLQRFHALTPPQEPGEPKPAHPLTGFCVFGFLATGIVAILGRVFGWILFG